VLTLYKETLNAIAHAPHTLVGVMNTLRLHGVDRIVLSALVPLVHTRKTTLGWLFNDPSKKKSHFGVLEHIASLLVLIGSIKSEHLHDQVRFFSVGFPFFEKGFRFFKNEGAGLFFSLRLLWCSSH
jgi:hypothetical protein